MREAHSQSLPPIIVNTPLRLENTAGGIETSAVSTRLFSLPMASDDLFGHTSETLLRAEVDLQCALGTSGSHSKTSCSDKTRHLPESTSTSAKCSGISRWTEASSCQDAI